MEDRLSERVLEKASAGSEPEQPQSEPSAEELVQVEENNVSLATHHSLVRHVLLSYASQ